MTSIAVPLGFVGIGHMGGAMAERLITAGHTLVVYDADRTACERLAARGATAVSSTREVADRCAIVMTCLPSVEASVAVARELAMGSKIATHIEHSTIGRQGMARVVAAHPSLPVIDAPVSGGPKGAQAGTLTMLVAGDVRAVRGVRPILDALASRVFVMGAQPGDAQIAKIVNNMLSISAMVMSCEALVLGVKAGLDATTLIDFINVSTGRNSATMDKFPRAILPRTFDYGGPLGIGVKDLELYMQEAATEGLSSSSVAHAARVWRAAVERLGPDVDLTTLIHVMEDEAGVQVGGPVFDTRRAP